MGSLISIVFTKIFRLLPIATLTFDLQPRKSIGFILSSWATFVLSLTKIHFIVFGLIAIVLTKL